jgi:hypothetical protein
MSPYIADYNIGLLLKAAPVPLSHSIRFFTRISVETFTVEGS